MSPGESIVLSALLDTLIPGDAAFPASSQLGLAARLAAHERFAPAVAPVLARLPGDFADLDEQVKIELIAAVERDSPTDFGALLTAVYSLYYTDETVLAAVAMAAGYVSRPPQPEGYALEPFDPAIVAVPAARRPHYRQAGGDSDGGR